MMDIILLCLKEEKPVETKQFFSSWITKMAPLLTLVLKKSKMNLIMNLTVSISKYEWVF